MSPLIELVKTMGVPFECSESGAWVRLPRSDGSVRYVVRSQLTEGYFAWVGHFTQQKAEWYPRLEDALGAAS
jgi:hypothetical protein